jgi:hypothetical protein
MKRRTERGPKAMIETTKRVASETRQAEIEESSRGAYQLDVPDDFISEVRLLDARF